MYKYQMDDNPVMHLTSCVCVTQVLSLQSFTFLAKYHIRLCSFNELFPTTFKYTHLFYLTFTIMPFVFRLVTEFQKFNPLSLYIDLCHLGITWNLQGEEAGQRGWKRKLWVWVSICRNPNPLYEHSLYILQVSCYHSVELLWVFCCTQYW
jgi:hypothetical protein